MRIADLRRDSQILEAARQDARNLLEQDSQLHNPSYARLRRMVLVRYGKALELSDVG